MRQISVEEAQVQFLALIEAALKGEEIIITQEDQPIIKFVTIDSPKPPRQPGSGKHLMITISADFDEPLEDFWTSCVSAVLLGYFHAGLSATFTLIAE